jgi:hypothetical protein
MATFGLVLPLLILAASSFSPLARPSNPASLRAPDELTTSRSFHNTHRAWPHGLSRTVESARANASVNGAHGARMADALSLPDGSGGQYVTWTEYRDGSADVYLLRVTNAGAPAAGWPTDGLAVCDAAGDQGDAALLPDGAGGVVVAWIDYRNDFLLGDAYAQHVDGSGVRGWAANGKKVLSGTADIHTVTAAPDGSGGLLVAWSVGTSLDGNIYAVRIGANGVLAPGWNATGNAVCTEGNNQDEPAIGNDGAGGAFVAWTDHRQGIEEIWAQRLNASGTPLWTANGLRVDVGVDGGHTPVLVSLGGANAIVAWYSALGPALAQGLNSVGGPMWNLGTPTALHPGTGPGTPSGDGLTAIPDGSGGAILSWISIDSGTYGMQAQRVDGAGAEQWGASGVSIVNVAGVFPADPDMVNDGFGGAFFSWSDDRNGLEYDAYVQHVTVQGSVVWAANGVGASIVARQQLPTFVAPDGAGGVLVSWVDNRSEDDEIFSQRFNASGTPQFAANGIATYLNPGQQFPSGIAQTADGGAIVVWNEKRNGQYDIRARKLNPDGTPAGSPTLITGAPGGQMVVGFVETPIGGCIVSWRDLSTDKYYAQRLDGNAAPLWTAGGVEIAPGAIYNDPPRMVFFPPGGAAFAWTDQRGSGLDIYAQRLDNTGARQWGTSGLAVCTDPASEFNPVIAYDNNSGAYIAWNDTRVQPGEIYMERVSAAGALNFGSNGFFEGIGNLTGATSVPPASGAYNDLVLLMNDFVFDSGSMQFEFVLSALKIDISGGLWWATATKLGNVGFPLFERIISDGSGGVYAGWCDSRNGPFDVIAQHITSAGAAEWGTTGAVVCSATGWQYLGGMTRIAGGDLVLTWADARTVYTDIYAQRIDPTGAAVLASNGVDVTPAARGQFFPILATWKTATPERLYLAWTDNRAGDTRYAYTDRLDLNLVSQWTAGGTTATTISLASAEADAEHVRLVWYSPSQVTATVYRRLEGDAWSAIGTASTDGTGRIEFEDRAIEPGRRYQYQLGVRENGTELFLGATWVEVPRTLALAIEGLRPNPAVRDFVVSFTLPHEGTAKIEWLDVTGRRVRVDEFAAIGAGRHALRLPGAAPPPGIYFLRLTQAGHSVTTRSAIVQ